MNAPPRLLQPLRDVVLYRMGDGNIDLDASKVATMKYKGTTFHIDDFFAVEYDDVATTGVDERDTTCVFTTSPHQASGLLAITATPATDPPVAGRAADPIKATTLASVVPDNAGVANDTNLAELDMLTVNSVTPVDDPAATIPVFQARGLGDFDLTITCSDAEMSVTDTATISVLPDGS